MNILSPFICLILALGSSLTDARLSHRERRSTNELRNANFMRNMVVYERDLQDGDNLLTVILDAPDSLKPDLCGNNQCTAALAGSTMYYFGNNPDAFLAFLNDAVQGSGPLGQFDGVGTVTSATATTTAATTTSTITTEQSTTASTFASTSTTSSTTSTVAATTTSSEESTTQAETTTSSTIADNTGTDPTTTTSDDIGGTTTTSTGDRGNFDPVVEEQNSSSLGAGPAVGIAGGALLLCFVCVGVGMSQRRKAGVTDSEDPPSAVKARQITVDEDDVEDGHGDRNIEVRRVDSGDESWHLYDFDEIPEKVPQEQETSSSIFQKKEVNDDNEMIQIQLLKRFSESGEAPSPVRPFPLQQDDIDDTYPTDEEGGFRERKPKQQPIESFSCDPCLCPIYSDSIIDDTVEL